MKLYKWYDGFKFEEIIYMIVNEIEPWRGQELARQKLSEIKDPKGLQMRVLDAMQFVTERESSVLSMIYSRGASKQSVANAWGISVHMVDQIGDHAIRLLRREKQSAIINGDMPSPGANLPENLAKSIYRVGLPSRAVDAFGFAGFLTLNDVKEYLERYGDFSRMHNIGEKYEAQIMEVLEKYAVRLEKKSLRKDDSIEFLDGVTIRIRWVLYEAGYRTIGQLTEVDLEDLMSLPSFGKKTCETVRNALAKHNFFLRLDDPERLSLKSRVRALGIPFYYDYALNLAQIFTVEQLVERYRESALVGIYGLDEEGRQMLEKKLIKKGFVEPKDSQL